MGTRNLLVALAALATCCAACASVPDIRFVEDGAPEGGVDGGDGGDARAKDAAPDASKCGAPMPTGGTCCGTVWCVGECGPANCEACVQKGCTTGELCCANPGTVQCKDRC